MSSTHGLSALGDLDGDGARGVVIVSYERPSIFAVLNAARRRSGRVALHALLRLRRVQDARLAAVRDDDAALALLQRVEARGATPLTRPRTLAGPVATTLWLPPAVDAVCVPCPL